MTKREELMVLRETLLAEARRLALITGPLAAPALLRKAAAALCDYEDAQEAMGMAETALAKLQRSKATYTLQQYVTDCNECHRQSASNLLPEHEYFCSSLERDDALAALRKAIGKEVEQPDD